MAITEPERAVAPLAIRLFGPLDVRLKGEPLPRLRSLKGSWLLALLTLRHDVEVERSWLAGLLWPDSPEPQALANLRNSLTDLRRALGPEAARLRSPTPHTLSLGLSGAEADVVAFDAAVAAGDVASLERAVSLYRGPLLEGCVEEWAFQERQTREQAFLSALEQLGAEAMGRGDYGAAERFLRRAAAVDPTRERAQRALMEALAASGNYAAATQVYRELRVHLHRELNAEPDPETRALYERLRAEARRRADQAGSKFKVEGSKSPEGATLNLEPSNLEPAQRARPVGAEDTVTFFFTDIVGSTRLWEEHPDTMRLALARHDAFLRDAIETNNGRVFKTVGDAFCAAFGTATDALDAALAAQRSLRRLQPSAVSPVAGLALLVRMALHTGAAEMREGDYLGPALNRVARLLEAGHGGQILLSGATQELVQDDLPPGVTLRDLGRHRLRDLQRPEHVFQVLHPDLPSEFPPIRSLDTRPNNLPAQPTPLIGRAQEVQAARELLLREDVRLVNFTGPGGTGKTRLSLQVAAELIDDFASGVLFVPLASISDPSLVASTLASTLEVRVEPGRPVQESLREHLRDKQMLLLLDNFEQIVAAAPLVAELLAAAPRLKILVTSRAVLHLRGEHEFPVPPLELPDLRRLPSAGPDMPFTLSQYAAVELFIQRALNIKPDFEVTNENAPAIAEICARLDGLPLAIELAAARVKLLPPQSLLSRLVASNGDTPLRLLTGGARDLPERQQTLRGAIAWSYDLLDEAERTLFRRLSVFVGGCTLEAAETVCGDAVGRGQSAGGSQQEAVGREGPQENDQTQAAGPGPAVSELPPADCLLPTDILEGLGSLVDKSLLRQQEETAGEPRFVMFETIREYARECLKESGAEPALRARHAECFLALAERSEEGLRGAQQAAWLDRLEREHDNLRAALDWYRESGATEKALRLGGALGRFWVVRSHHEEGRERLTRLLALPGASARTLERARALNALGNLAPNHGNLATKRALHEESLSIYRELGEKRGITVSLNSLGNVALNQGDLAAARAFHEENLAIQRELGDQRGTAFSLSNLGSVAQAQGDLRTARTRYEESLAIMRSLGDKRSIAYPLSNLGVVAALQKEYEAARAFYREALEIVRELGDKGGIAWALSALGNLSRQQVHWEAARALLEESLEVTKERRGSKLALAPIVSSLASVALHQGESERATALYREALALAQDVGARPIIADCLAGLAIAPPAPAPEAQAALARRAVRLFAAAGALREAVGSTLLEIDRALYERQMTAARRLLGDEAFQAAQAEGRALTLDQAVAEARGE